MYRSILRVDRQANNRVIKLESQADKREIGSKITKEDIKNLNGMYLSKELNKTIKNLN